MWWSEHLDFECGGSGHPIEEVVRVRPRVNVTCTQNTGPVERSVCGGVSEKETPPDPSEPVRPGGDHRDPGAGPARPPDPRADPHGGHQRVGHRPPRSASRAGKRTTRITSASVLHSADLPADFPSAQVLLFQRDRLILGEDHSGRFLLPAGQ